MCLCQTQTAALIASGRTTDRRTDMSKPYALGRRGRVLQIAKAIQMLEEAMTEEEQWKYPVIQPLLDLVASHVEK